MHLMYVLLFCFCRAALILLLLVIIYVVLVFVCHGFTLPTCIRWGNTSCYVAFSLRSLTVGVAIAIPLRLFFVEEESCKLWCNCDAWIVKTRLRMWLGIKLLLANVYGIVLRKLAPGLCFFATVFLCLYMNSINYVYILWIWYLRTFFLRLI